MGQSNYPDDLQIPKDTSITKVVLLLVLLKVVRYVLIS